MGFELYWVGVRSIACLEVGPRRGFARESLGELSNFQVVASGSQQMARFQIHLSSIIFGHTELLFNNGF